MSDASKTLLLVTPYFPPHSGGLERYALELGKSMHKRGWRVVVVTSGEKRAKEDKDGCTVYRLPLQFKISNTPLSFGWYSDIRKIARDEKPDIINVHTPVPGIGDIAAFVTRKTPLIVTYHSGSMRKGIWWIDIVVWLYEHGPLRILLHRAHHIYSASDAVRTSFLKDYAHKCSTLAPAVNSKFFSPAPMLPHEARILFITARLSRAYAHKGLDSLLRVLERLQKKGIPAALDIVGDGELRAEYVHRIHTSGLVGVRLRGHLSGSFLADAYKEASLFVLPTSNDSYPIAILEAQSSGLPVISTYVGDIPRMIDEGETGFLVPARDEDALYEKLERLVTHPELRATMGKRARERVLAHFTWDDRAERMAAVCEESVSRRPHLVHIAGYYPPHIGGIERVVSTASRMLAEKGESVQVITSGGPYREVSGNCAVEKLWSVEIAHTPFAPTLLFHLLALPRKSIIHLHLAQAYWPDMVRLASWIRGIPYIAHYHLEVEASGILGPLFTVYKRLTWGPFLRGARSVIVCSDEQKKWIHVRYRVNASKITVIPNAVGETFFAKEHEPPREKLQILTIGRLVNQKRIDRLVDACALLKIPYHLTIAGDGEDRVELEARAKDKGVSATFVGSRNDAQMQELHRTHDVFLISSEREGGTPLTVLEAFAAGLPVIAADVPGVRELVQDSGVLVAPDPTFIARAIEELWSDPARYQELSKRGIEKARNYTWPVYICSLQSVYAAVNSAKIDELQGAGKAAHEAYNSYGEGDAGAPQRSRSRFSPNSPI